jgi:hypothetical protein
MPKKPLNPDQPHDAQRQRPEVPWDKIRRTFVCNPEMSIAAIARKYHVSRVAISNRAHSRGWHAMRIRFMATVERKASEDLALELARVATQNIAETVQQLSEIRRKLIAKLDTELDEERVLIDDVVESTTVDKKTGETKRMCRRMGRPKLDSKLAGQILRVEATLLAHIAQLDDRVRPVNTRGVDVLARAQEWREALDGMDESVPVPPENGSG